MSAGPVISTLLFANFMVGHVRVWGCPTCQGLLTLGRDAIRARTTEVRPVAVPSLQAESDEPKGRGYP